MCIFNEISLCKYEGAFPSISNIWTKFQGPDRRLETAYGRSQGPWLIGKGIDSTQLCQNQVLLYIGVLTICFHSCI